MKQIDRHKCSPFFDQEDPQAPVKGMIATLDISPSWELYAAAVFKCEGRGYLVVFVSGCSCWPDRGVTTQKYCIDRISVDRELMGTEFSELRHLCQNAGWKPTKTAIFEKDGQ